ncbi:type VI secretion system protein TssL, long form [Methylophaga sp.]|jgi:chemotaxis protein MotB|uniref:type VI secretion system protein TssL, long form n=1 Tax=Methylophaga sp. TaxID=2024840 RepID=UPI0013FFA5F4|nr:type VI secretion system protein TssL, long form [Methylophaga sp.]MTI62363.1 type VI secretion system protein TssL [Methylophaga sp.]
MSENSNRVKRDAEGLPAYMATFADLMSLLMCFFVLLLSFAEIDALKYKMVVKSLETAFGVQREVPKDEIPEGTSIIAQEFSPGEPKPTPLKVVRQDTMDETREQLKVTADAEQLAQQQVREVAEETQEFREALEQEIKDGLIVVESQFSRIVIRIREKGSFPSGDARLNPGFIPILRKIHDVLLTTDGRIAVAGHTDNVPINTVRYRSNWELSTSRATSVVHELLAPGVIPADRFVLEGYADTKPLVPNDTAENRAKNRRVEIIVLKSPVEEELTRSIDELMQEHESVDSEISPLYE